MRPFLLTLPLLAVLAACGSGDRPQSGLYIALGDSLSEGVGASDRSTAAFVPLVRDGLGEEIELLNLGHSGDTSEELLGHGHLDAALSEIHERSSDDDRDNDVRLVTLEIGGNDLLTLFDDLVLSGACLGLESALAKPICVDALSEALDRLRTNLAVALGRLQEADPDVRIVVMTLYNPLSRNLGLLGVVRIRELAELALEGGEDTPFHMGVNDIIREETAKRGLTLVDLHSLFQGKADEYIFVDFIHPNDTGYRVMADAVLEAVR